MNTHQTFLELSTDLLQIGQSIRFRADGVSMAPTILHGDFLTVTPVEPSAIRKGDIILYRNGRSTIAHRVVNVDAGKSFLLRGDALEAADAPVGPNQILGRVVSLERAGRTIDPNSARIKIVLMARRLGLHIKVWLARRLSEALAGSPLRR